MMASWVTGRNKEYDAGKNVNLWGMIIISKEENSAKQTPARGRIGGFGPATSLRGRLTDDGNA